jgi:hypothetical protein
MYRKHSRKIEAMHTTCLLTQPPVNRKLVEIFPCQQREKAINLSDPQNIQPNISTNI